MKTIFKNSLYLMIISLFTHSCNHETHTHSHVQEENSVQKAEVKVNEVVYQKGFEILESNCISCHSVKGTFEDRIAPPLAAVKNKYLKEYKTKEEFIANFVSFVENPTLEKSKMTNAVEKFNLMPKMGYSIEQVTAVAEYIYANEVESETWYQKHFQNEKAKYSGASMSDLERGQQLAMKSKAVLGKNLMGTIKKSGTDEALAFCNERAYPLIDSMATFLNANIKRVSNKPRNQNNEANDQELLYINQTIAKLASGETIKGEIHEENGENIAYYPITTNEMCLQCHGTPKEHIKESTLSLLTQLYPKDKAVGYHANQLRGIWVVEFE